MPTIFCETDKSIYAAHLFIYYKHFSKNALIVAYRIILPHIADIQKAITYNHDIYLLFDNNKLQKLELISIAKLVSKLYQSHNHHLCAKVAVAFHSTVVQLKSRRYVPISMLADLKHQIEAEKETELARQVDRLLEDAELIAEDKDRMSDTTSERSKVTFDRLESGIYVLRQRTESEGSANADIKTSPAFNDQDQPVIIKDESDNLTNQKERKAEDCERIPTIEQQKTTQEDVIGTEGSLSRHQSPESLVSLNSMSSSELMFGTLNVGTCKYFHSVDVKPKVSTQ